MFGWWKAKKPDRVAELEGVIEVYKEIQTMHLRELDRHREEERARVADMERRAAVSRAAADVTAVFGARMDARVFLDGEDRPVAARAALHADPLLHAACLLAGIVEGCPEGHRGPHADCLLALRGVVGAREPVGRAVERALCDLEFSEEGEGKGEG